MRLNDIALCRLIRAFGVPKQEKGRSPDVFFPPHSFMVQVTLLVAIAYYYVGICNPHPGIVPLCRLIISVATQNDLCAMVEVR